MNINRTEMRAGYISSVQVRQNLASLENEVIVRRLKGFDYSPLLLEQLNKVGTK